MSEERRDARKRNLERRRRSRLGSGEARVVTCPSCRGHIRVKPDGDDPEICGGCGSRLLCGNCKSALVEFTEEQKAGGTCPRCEEPYDPDHAGQEDEEWTWNER